jgi:hypothetical protein
LGTGAAVLGNLRETLLLDLRESITTVLDEAGRAPDA